MKYDTSELCDIYHEEVNVVEPLFSNFGGRTSFGGKITTVKCFEDNGILYDLLEENGAGRVLLVDGGGSVRRALIDAELADWRRKAPGKALWFMVPYVTSGGRSGRVGYWHSGNGRHSGGCRQLRRGGKRYSRQFRRCHLLLRRSSVCRQYRHYSVGRPSGYRISLSHRIYDKGRIAPFVTAEFLA